jgi:glutaredoxin
VDSSDCLRAWAESLGGITYPLLSDFFPHGQTAQTYGVLRPEGYSERALFVIDRAGIIRYIDIHEITDQPDNEVLFGVLENLEPEAAARYHALRRAAQTPSVPEGDVVIFCTPWCPDCHMLRNYLKDSQVEFVEVDISRNAEAARRVREWCGGKEITPVIKIKGSEIIVDYDRQRLETALDKLHRDR